MKSKSQDNNMILSWKQWIVTVLYWIEMWLGAIYFTVHTQYMELFMYAQN